MLSRSAIVRVFVLALLYAASLSASLLLAYLLRFDFAFPAIREFHPFSMLGWILPLKLVVLIFARQFEGLLSYFGIPDLRRLLLANLLCSGCLALIWFASYGVYAPPRGVILADFVFSVSALSSVRLGFRLLRERYLSDSEYSKEWPRKRVGIIGAGDVGAKLASELAVKRGSGLNPVAFFDDDRNKWRSRIHDIPVIGAPERLLDSKLNLNLDEVVIALPSASAKRIGEIVRVLQQSRLKFLTVPSMDQLATGKVRVSQLRSVEIQDLLGREPVKLEMASIEQVLKGKVVMVTGGGGSIGSELCRQILNFNPTRLLLVEQSEVQIFQIEQELLERGSGASVVPLVADVLDEPRMRFIFQRYQPQVVFHAAAHKHVPMMEIQPSEAIKNNSFGTARMATLAVEHGVERFVLISTDKAINPTNVMGASKRLAELYLQALHGSNPGRTKMMAVRFGNVLGSSGSVIPTFQKQIAAGGPVKVTHPEVTRYFMTIPEACSLVLQAGAQGEGGEIFVLDMGDPVKIVDLAKQLIELTGLKVEEDIEIEFTGLRPGEKLFEELSHKGENITPTHHPKIMRFVSTPQKLEQVKELFRVLDAGLNTMEPDQFKLLIQSGVPEYKPFLQ